MSQTETLEETSDSGKKVIRGISLVLCAAVAFLILGPRPQWAVGAIDVSALPTVNATLNGLSVVLLLSGFAAVKSGRIELHKKLMISAFCTSAAFLVTYVIYHWFQAGPAEYTGGYRTVYLAILVTHVILAAIILPFALDTIWRGWSGRIKEHKAIAPRTLGMWLYVGITGVVIYWMLYG